jgi:ATPase family associated with various cellular activities (AAA)
MAGLEDSIEELRELDFLREQVEELRKSAINALPTQPYPDPAVQSADVDLIEMSLVLKVLRLCEREHIEHDKYDDRNLAATLAKRWSHSHPDLKGGPVSTFSAARVMQALVATPGFIFTEATYLCYYRLLRELYTADAESTTGGVPAGEGALSTAFMTGESVRAIIAFAHALETTAALATKIEAWKQAMDTAATLPEALAGWADQERGRATRSFLTWALQNKDHFLIDLGEELDQAITQPVATFDALIRTGALRKRFAKLLTDNISALKAATVRAKALRKKERSIAAASKPAALTGHDNAAATTFRRFTLTESAHILAMRALEDGTASTTAFLAQWERGDEFASWGDLATALKLRAARVRHTLRPAEYFLKSVLDRELSEAASGRLHHCDYPELAFAAAGYSVLGKRWDDMSLQRAAKLLAENLGTDGLFPLGRPIRVDNKGNRLEVMGFEVLRAVADVLRRARGTFTADFVRRMLRLVDDTRTDADKPGWRQEHMPRASEPTWSANALCGIALHRIVRLLSEHLNREVLRHFFYRTPANLKIKLDAMFYSDFGLATEARRSVAFTLLRMSAHLGGLGEVQTGELGLWSLILYGPPGTGKTTLAEALAASADVILVEVTPSDLIVSGAEGIERKARAVFEALAMLTNVVILFDEFDSVLKRRRPGDKIRDVFGFLTPGMLPKLKLLHDRAEKHRVAYLLATNIVGDLDHAAIRAGRFDEKVGVYPPDIISRTGRFFLEALRFKQAPTEDEWNRAAEIIRASRGAAMNDIAKPSWFTAPKPSKLKARSPFQFVFGRESDAERNRLPPMEPLPGYGPPNEHRQEQKRASGTLDVVTLVEAFRKLGLDDDSLASVRKVFQKDSERSTNVISEAGQELKTELEEIALINGMEDAVVEAMKAIGRKRNWTWPDLTKALGACGQLGVVTGPPATTDLSQRGD